MSKIVVIGSGFSGLSAACYLAAAGNEVHVYEKNSEPGGRVRQFRTEEGFVFDMGPSWYWMPGVYEQFFNDFGYQTADLYRLDLLDPAFDVVYGKDEVLRIPDSFDDLCALFESIEAGSADRLKKFMREAEFKYRTGMEDLVYKPGLSVMEYVNLRLWKSACRLHIFSSLSAHIRRYFKNPRLIALMEFPSLFLGAMPQDIPALYSLMNYAGFRLGTWYPHGGFGKVVDAFVRIAKENGVVFHFNSPVDKINTLHNRVYSLDVNGHNVICDGVIASADYHHVESRLLPEDQKNYRDDYWPKKTFAPSSLIFYLGVNKKLNSLNHHTLFFDEDLDKHSREIYKNPQWPSRPLFYVCCPSRTDESVAPAGSENLFLLMPLAPGLEDNEELRGKYFHIMLDRLEHVTGEDIRTHIVYKKSYCVNDFITDYNAYKGNAYGLANTLRQTALLKPKMTNRKIGNLIYTGQLTVPGPGVPPSIISGKVASGLMSKIKWNNHEVAI